MTVGEHTINEATFAKNLCVWIDKHLTLSHQIHQVCKSAFHQIFSIYKIRPHLTQAATQTLEQAHVVSRLD